MTYAVKTGENLFHGVDIHSQKNLFYDAQSRVKPFLWLNSHFETHPLSVYFWQIRGLYIHVFISAGNECFEHFDCSVTWSQHH